METVYNYCDNCDNIMYIYLDKDVEIPKLYLYCKACMSNIQVIYYMIIMQY